METVMGGGHYICEKCGVNTFGSVIHYCKIPKEKPMNKVIFESEEEIRNIWKYFLSSNNYEEFKDRLNEHGHIRKSPVEEAEEIYKNFLHEYENPGVDTSCSNTVACIKTQHEALQYLKAENERLKNREG